jgi:hypothetical protein
MQKDYSTTLSLVRLGIERLCGFFKKRSALRSIITTKTLSISMIRHGPGSVISGVHGEAGSPFTKPFFLYPESNML